MASPPKPWERNRAAGTATTSSTINMTDSSATTAAAAGAPAVPPIPSSLTSTVNQNAAAYSRLGGLGATPGALGSPYGTYGAGTGYSPYRYGGSYGGMGGGMGGGMYGGGMYGGGMGGMGGMYGGGMYGGGMGGMGGMAGPNDPNSLTQRFNTSTQATFQMLEGVVGAFGGFAQMLESTYMATHSSFYAMISVAEQFGNLRDALGSILGIFTLMRWIRTLIARLTGRPLPADAMALTPAAFAKFEGRAVPAGADGSAPKPSRKPLFFFILAAFGLPYLMSKAIKTLAASNVEEERRQMGVLQQQQQQGPVDASKLDFCRVLYDYTPDPALVAQAATAGSTFDVAVKRDDLVVVLAKTDPAGNPSDWWQCRTRDGRIGYLPSSYLKIMETVKKQQQQQQIMPAPPAPPSVDGSVSSASTAVPLPTMAASRAAAAAATPDPIMAEKAAAQKKAAEAGADSFMKSAFYQ